MQVLTHVDQQLIPSCRADGEFFWLDLVAPNADDLRGLSELLGWNPLLTEDLEHGGQRPKVEDFADHALVVVYAVQHSEGDELELIEHGIVVHGDYVVTIRSSDLPGFTHLRETIAANDDGIVEAAVVHRVLDLIVDMTMVATDAISDAVDRLERQVDIDANEHVRDGLRACRRALVNLRGIAVAQSDALYSLADSLDAIPGFEVGLRSHFRDVTDHAHRVVDQLDVSRDLLDAAFEAYNTTLIARQGEVTQRLTVIATIFLPLTFVTGFFGQNFTWMVEHVDSRRDFLVFGCGATLLTGLILVILFRRLRWW